MCGRHGGRSMHNSSGRAASETNVRRNRAVAVLAVAATVVGLAQAVAWADTVTNNVTVGGNDTVTVGGTTSVSYTLNATHDPGEPGNSPKCNAAGSPVVVTIAMTVPNGTT